MKVLIVYAHPQPGSFNWQLKEMARVTLLEQGHEVKVSDLYAINFKPSVENADFLAMLNPKQPNYLMEQKNASAKNAFSADILAEMDKVRWADFIIFHFPIWWFSAPAILKGWFDRVLAVGFAWDFDGKVYDQGLLKGKRALLAVTTAAPAAMYGQDAPHGLSLDQMLFLINHNVLYFCGVAALEPFKVFGVYQLDDAARKNCLQEYKKRLLAL